MSLETNFNAIKRLDNGKAIKKVAVDLDVEVTEDDWKQKQNDIEKWVEQSVSGGLERKTMKKGEYNRDIWFSHH